MNKIVLDTNVLIYALDIQSAFHERSVAILQAEDNQLFITTKNISEYFAVCSKLAIEREKVFGFYEDLLTNVIFLYPSEASLQFFHFLLQKYEPKGNRVYDVEIVSVMLAHQLRHVATFNVADFRDIAEVEIFNK